MPGKGFGWQKLAMLEEIMFIMSDLASKIWALAHPACSGNACTKTRPFASTCPVACMKVDIQRYRNKMTKTLYCIFGAVPFSILEARFNNLCKIIHFVAVCFLWSEKNACGLNSMVLQWEGLLFQVLVHLCIRDFCLLHSGRHNLHPSI